MLPRDWEHAATSTYGDWDSFKWEIWNGEGIEDTYAPLIEESGPWIFPGSPTRSTTYSLLKYKSIYQGIWGNMKQVSGSW